MKPLKIYMCDLTHDTIVLVSDTIPINIGFIASYAKKIHGDAVAISLFKYPQTAIEAIQADPPDVLALSNYSWNSNLSERLAGIAKEANPAVVTVQGGTNFPHAADHQLDFLLKRPNTDFHTVLEGETAFANLVGRVLDGRDGGSGPFDAPVGGCVYIEPSTRLSQEPALVTGGLSERIRDLDDIPSPYLSGMLDHFFDGRLAPFIETNRGCPFKCAFCHTGANYFQKINNFSIERVREEIRYAARKAAETGVTIMHLADTNFGMYPRDREICEELKHAQDTHGWPRQVVATTGKNQKERVIDITGILGKVFEVTMSVQSMDDAVLENIRRSNIKLDDYMKINKHLQSVGRETRAELILGLPGETRESFVKGIEQVIEAGVSGTTIYSLMLLHGTEFQDPAYRKKFEIVGKYRIVPLNFGEYAGERVFDYEEVGIANKDMPFEDYCYVRGYALMVATVQNDRVFEEFFRYALSLGEKRTSFLRRLHDNIAQAPEKIQDIVAGFMAETKSELWDSEEALVAYYREDENYEKLKRGEAGGNLIYKYKSQSLAFTMGEWIGYLSDQLKELAAEKIVDEKKRAAAFGEIDCIADFCRHKAHGLLDAAADTSPVEMLSPYDVAAWMRDEETEPLAKSARERPVHYRFEYTEDQLRERDSLFRRYGTDVSALSKIVTRVSNYESLFRKVLAPDGEEEIYRNLDRDRLTRYALEN